MNYLKIDPGFSPREGTKIPKNLFKQALDCSIVNQPTSIPDKELVQLANDRQRFERKLELSNVEKVNSEKLFKKVEKKVEKKIKQRQINKKRRGKVENRKASKQRSKKYHRSCKNHKLKPYVRERPKSQKIILDDK